MVEPLEMTVIKYRKLLDVEVTRFILVWKVPEVFNMQELRGHYGSQKLLRHAFHIDGPELTELINRIELEILNLQGIQIEKRIGNLEGYKGLGLLDDGSLHGCKVLRGI